MKKKKRAIKTGPVGVIFLLVVLTAGIIIWQASLIDLILVARDAVFIQQESFPNATQAMQFVWGRKQAYEQANRTKDWKMRGVGYLYHAHNIVLAAKTPDNTNRAGQHQVMIHNAMNSTSLDCSRLTIWVRVNGPEIFAGSAIAVQADNEPCYWKFAFDLQVAGDYHVDAKALLWDAHVPVNMTPKLSQCAETTGLPPAGNWPVHSSMAGFKFYSPAEGCCEICTRITHCRYWATPPLDYSATPVRNGCELYFDAGQDPDNIPSGRIMEGFKANNHSRRSAKKVPQAHGAPHPNPTSYFVGCGWSFWMTLEIPCLSGDLDDRVYLPRSSFAFDGTNQHAAPQLPLCTLQDEHLEKHQGRWVRQDWPDANKCPQPFAFHKKLKGRFQMTIQDGNHPHCWHRDDLSICCHKCSEMNCGLITKQSKWIGPLHQEQQWFGYWQPYHCDYLEFTNTQLQQCIIERKIASITVRGASIAKYLEQYIQLRTESMVFYNETLPGAKHVVLDTLALLHIMRYGELMHQKLKAMPAVNESTEEHYWVSGFYLSSEREPLGHLHAMNQSNYAAFRQLQPKGYKLINNFDMSAAFTYDTATQFDGMHIIGPPMKMTITKLFHFMCKDTVQGGRLSEFN